MIWAIGILDLNANWCGLKLNMSILVLCHEVGHYLLRPPSLIRCGVDTLKKDSVLPLLQLHSTDISHF
jgi:hypothetical protein